MGDADSGGGGSGLEGSLAKEMPPSSMLQRNAVFPEGPGVGTAKGAQPQPLRPRRPQLQTHQTPLPLWGLL